MIRARLLAVSAFGAFLGAAVLVACGDDEQNPNPGRSSSGTTSGGEDAASGGTSGGPPTGEQDAGSSVNLCKTFTDRSGTDAKRIIPWDFSISTALERCMQIKVGQTVRWGWTDGGVLDDFTDHPVIVKNGTTPSPIKNISATGEVTFDAAGTFGYQCQLHGSAMAGAILVAP